MKRLLLPFLALALCPPAHADKATFKLSDLPPLPKVVEPGTTSLLHSALFVVVQLGFNEVTHCPLF